MRSIILASLLLFCFSGVAQSDILAKNYFEQGEYGKAISIYKKLYEQNKGRLDYLMRMVESHQQLEEFEKAETLLTERINNRRGSPQLLVELGYNASLQNNDSIANIHYEQAIDYIEQNANYAYNIGAAFSKYSLLDRAAQTYEKAMIVNPERDFNPQLATIYGEQGKLQLMFEKYIDIIQNRPMYKNVAQRNFSLYVTEDSENEANKILRKTLLKKSQQNPDILYNELLSWLFVQQKEFNKAFIQEKAIYKRDFEEDLGGIADVARAAIDEKDYEVAEEIFTFIIEKSLTLPEKIRGNQYLMEVLLAKATPKDYKSIEEKFKALFDEFGYGKETYMLQIEYNHFLAFNAGKKDEAISNLKKLSKERLSAFQEARVKMELSDILVFDEKFNQALIYYSQIQKKVQNDKLAQEARFKVARTSYYKGDFEWAQVQLDVLKKSASQLIANDAMQLSLMIRDNTLEDSTQTALKKFAKADLLALQNKNAEAIAVLDDILTNHKGEKIEDEALLQQAKLFEKTEQFTQAEVNYNKIIELYKDDILADDAHYRLAILYEGILQNPQKAKELYEQIIFTFKDSIYFVDARKRFRSLRGDAIE
jgi:tetratricopeptide (TPR) repeat protein